MNDVKLIDPHNRHLNYLRISITDRCNLRCLYCMPHGRIPKLDHREILSYEEILRLVGIATRLGITKVRVTGGEPLVRKGACGLLADLSKVPGLVDVSLTTNGVLLKGFLERIKAAGIRRINISLDSLDRKKFKHITGYDRFTQVWQGIEKARELGFSPIKINVVALKGINDDELIDFGRLSITHPFHIRFIEYMPIGTARIDPREHLLTDQIKAALETLGPLHPVPRTSSDGPAQRYGFAGAKGEVGFISALSRHFCHQCNRLRLTASGQLRVCLLSDRQVDLKGPLRDGASDNDLAQIYIRAVRHKGSQHHLSVEPDGGKVSGQMSGIGG
jgi:cyclic pyranopterin phosphate synthase